MASASRLYRTVLPVAVAAGSAAFSAPLLLDGPAPAAVGGASVATTVRPGRDSTGDKLPIYPTPQTPVTLIETTHPLVPYITQAREATQGAFRGATEVVESGVNRWIGFERKVQSEVSSLIPSNEPLLPGALYVLISGLTGSVLTRTRALPLRLLTPPLFTLLAAPYFLPQTSHNIRSYLARIEDAHAPALAAEHDRLNAQVGGAVRAAREALGGAEARVRGLGGRAVRGVEEATGLRVGETIRDVREKGRGEVVRRLEEARGKREGEGRELEVVGYVVEQKPVAEIVAPVEKKKDEGKRSV